MIGLVLAAIFAVSIVGAPTQKPEVPVAVPVAAQVAETPAPVAPVAVPTVRVAYPPVVYRARMLPHPVVAEIRGAQMFLRELRADWHDPYLVKAVIAWFRAESGYVSRVIGNNPFNIRPGSASGDAIGVREGGYLVFPTLTTGFSAAATVLTSTRMYGYPRIVRYAREGNALRFLSVLSWSCWSSAHYGARTGAESRTAAHNRLIAIYRGLPMPVRPGLRVVPVPPETSTLPEPPETSTVATTEGATMTTPTAALAEALHIHGPHMCSVEPFTGRHRREDEQDAAAILAALDATPAMLWDDLSYQAGLEDGRADLDMDQVVTTGGFDPALSCGHGPEIARLRAIEEAARAVTAYYDPERVEPHDSDAPLHALRAALGSE